MIKQMEVKDIAKEFLEVSKYFESNFTSKIPDKVLKELRDLATESNIIVTINKNKSLKEQNVSKECKNLISLIYYNYIATEEERKEIIINWKYNEEEYQKQIKEKYNKENLFKKINSKQENKEKLTLPAIIKKENFITKIKNLLRKVFK